MVTARLEKKRKYLIRDINQQIFRDWDLYFDVKGQWRWWRRLCAFIDWRVGVPAPRPPFKHFHRFSLCEHYVNHLLNLRARSINSHIHIYVSARVSHKKYLQSDKLSLGSVQRAKWGERISKVVTVKTKLWVGCTINRPDCCIRYSAGSGRKTISTPKEAKLCSETRSKSCDRERGFAGQ